MAPHVALVPFPFASHPGALFSLLRALAAAAPEATFTFLSTAQSLTPIVTEADCLSNVRLVAIGDGCPSPPPADTEDRIGLFLRAAPRSIREGMAAAKEAAGVAVSSIVSDSFMWAARELAEEMHVPWVALWTGHPGSLFTHVNTDLLRETLGVGDNAVSTKGDEMLNSIPGLSTMRVRDLPYGVISGDLDSGFPRMLYQMGKELPIAAAVIVNTIEGLEPAVDSDLKSRFNAYLPIGPINLLSAPASMPEDPEGCLPWLDNQEAGTVVYISFGTASSLPPGEQAALAEGLEVSGTPFLWSIKERFREQLPAGFLERTQKQGLVVSWAPQVQVLAHPAIGATVNNCGWNSVMESISSGTPMVCRPLIGDHMMAERMVTKGLRIGVGFKERVVTKEAVVRALEFVLQDEEGKKMWERICKLKNMAVEAVGLEGSSMKNFKTLMEIVLI